MAISGSTANILRRSAALAAITITIIGASVYGRVIKQTPDGESASRNIECFESSSGSSVCIRETGAIVASGTVTAQGIVLSSGAYLTASQADGMYVDVGGDTMTGELIVEANMTGDTLTVSDEARVPKTVIIPLCDGATDCSAASGALFVMRGQGLRGSYALSGAYLDAATAGTTGEMTVNIRNHTDDVNVFSTTLNLYTGEVSSTGSYVIGNGTLSEGDRLEVYTTAVHTTAAKGVSMSLDLIPQ